MKKIKGISILGIVVLLFVTAAALGQSEETAIPKLIKNNGRYALLVDGKPFFMLGGQVHNSSAWPKMLPQVWTAIDGMHANTLEIPIYWQQIEPQEATFDFSLMDTIIMQARRHDVRLVLLWFATWKNGNTDYTPNWVKLNPKKYSHMVNRAGKTLVSASPHSKAFMEADAKAFTAVMQHLKEFDPQYTVIMVQVENEPGTYGSPRDFSAAAEKLFQSPFPSALLKPEVLKELNRPTNAEGTWQNVFGSDADEYFHTWSVASYINYVAQAGKAVNPLPMYVNVSLEGEPGGAMHDVIPIYKVAAPAISILGPDIYQSKEKAMKTIEYYDRPDNPLFVPETFGSADYLYEVIRRGGIGFSPFGVDAGLPNPNADAVTRPSPLSAQYAMLRLADKKLANWIFENRIHVVQVTEKDTQEVNLGKWRAKIIFNTGRRFGAPAPVQAKEAPAPNFGFGAPIIPTGRALIAQLGENEFVVMGTQCRVIFFSNGDKTFQFLKVEEGHYYDGVFKLTRLRNGDEVGFSTVSIGPEPVLLRVTLAAL